MAQSKWAIFDNEIKLFFEQKPTLDHRDCAKKLQPNSEQYDLHAFDVYIKRNKSRILDANEGATEGATNNLIEDSKSKSESFEPFKNGNVNNILIIGDVHAPFTKKGYLKFCLETQKKYKCGTVVFIGDIIDNHYSSYHESDPDGYSAGEELDRAIDMIKDWYHTFPKATVIIGNHDRIVNRKAFTSGISKRWIRDYKDVLETSGWDFVENLEIFGININHGEGGTARNRIKTELQSQVQGHLHTQLYVDYLVGANFIVFGMQVGCGIDIKSYAMAYGRNFKKPAIGCGVILNKGTLPIPIAMKM